MTIRKPDEVTTPSVESRSLFGVIIHSFFIVPFLIAVAAVLLFAGVRMLTREEHSVKDYLEDIRIGGLTKRWQAAFELSKYLIHPHRPEIDSQLLKQLEEAFAQSVHDDPRVRQYLALALGRTGHVAFAKLLTENLSQESSETLPAILYAIGMLGQAESAPQVVPFLEDSNPRTRLAAVIALGSLNNSLFIPDIEKMLVDPEPNVRWDAAIALAKLGSASGREILLQLLDREYLSRFSEIDASEKNHILLTALEAAAKLQDSQMNQVIKSLAQTDPNMNVRKLAMALINHDTVPG